MQATPVYGGGVRRSAAPQVNILNPATQSARLDDNVLNALLLSMQEYSQAAQSSQSPRSDLVSDSFTSGGAGDFGGVSIANDNQVTGSLNDAIAGIGTIAQMMSAAGYLAQNQEINEAGNLFGQTASVANAIANPSLSSLAPVGLQALGVNPAVGGAVMGGINNGVPGALSGAAAGGIAMMHPAIAALSAMSGMFGGPTLGSITSSVVGSGPSMSPAGVPNTGSGVVGAIMNALNVGQLGQEVYGGVSAAEPEGGIGLTTTTAPNNPSMGGGQGITLGGTGIGLQAPTDSFSIGGGSNSSMGGDSFGFGGVSASSTGNIGFGGGSLGGFASGDSGPSSSGPGSDATSGVAGSTAATASSPDGPDGSNASAPGGDGGGGGGGKIICTKLYELGMMPKEIYQADQAFGKQLVARSPETYAGYVRWARSVVAMMSRKDLLGKVTVCLAYWIATPWSKAMAAEMGVDVKPSLAGKALLKYGLKVCKFLGKSQFVPMGA